MGQWPFGNPLPEIELMQREVLDDADDDFNDDVDDESEDEGHITDEESYSEDDNEWGNFGLAPMLMNILF